MLVNREALLSNAQHTLFKSTDPVAGFTLRNHPATIVFKPLPPNSGRRITVTSRGRQLFSFVVGLANSDVGITWTEAFDPATGKIIGVIEHPAAAVVLAALDNVEMVIDYPNGRPLLPFYKGFKASSVPLMTGNAVPYLEAINAAGVVKQAARRKWLTVREAYEVPYMAPFESSSFRLEPRDHPGWSINAINGPRKAPWWHGQARSLGYDLTHPGSNATLERIATARPTNGGDRDWWLFHLGTLGTRRQPDFSVMQTSWHEGPYADASPYLLDEAIHHRHLDLLGDIFFFAGYIRADITVENGRHKATNVARHHLATNQKLLLAA